MDYDQEYARVDALFGSQPEATLQKFAGRLAPGSVVLDIGAGQGRNAVFLARRGLAVHAMEPSDVAAAALQQVAEREHLALEVFRTTFERFHPPVSDYAGILVFGLTPDLTWTAIHELVKRVGWWSGSGTLIWVTGFTTQDPAYDHHRANWSAIGPSSFRSAEGSVRTYLEPGQVLKLFEGYAVLHRWEGLGPEHRRGDGPLERHGKFEIVLLKRGGRDGPAAGDAVS